MKTLVRTFFKLRYFTLATLLLIAFLACSNDDEPEETKNLPIRLSTTSDATKAASIGKQLPAEQQIGVFFAENPTIDLASGKMYEPNLKYTTDGNGELSGTIQYFPGNKNGVKISAYHPYIDNSADEYTFSVNSDQTTNANVYNSDLLYCPEFAQAKTEGTVTIKLNHKLSQIVFDLAAGNNSPDLTDAQITLLNVNTSVTFNRRTGAISNPSNPQDVKLNKDGNGGIVIPQTLPAGTRFAKIRLKNGKEMFYTTTTALTLVGNKKHTVTLKVNKTETIGIGTEVGEWGDGGTTDGEAVEDNSKKLLPIEIVDQYFMLNNLSKYLFTYDTKNRVSTMEWWFQTNGARSAHMLITFNYSASNEITSYVTDIIHDANLSQSWKELSECIYSDGKVTIKTTELRSNLISERIIYMDSRKNYLNSPSDSRTYDANGNTISNDLFKYDNKRNAVYYLSLPGWFIKIALSANLCTGKNNLIEISGQPFDMEYNAEGYPTKMSYTKIISGKPKEYKVTIKYKKWDE